VTVAPCALPAPPLSSAGVEHQSQDIFYPSPASHRFSLSIRHLVPLDAAHPPDTADQSCTALSGASSRTNAVPSHGSRCHALCFSPTGPARAHRPPLFTAVATLGEPPPQATRIVAVMGLGKSLTMLSSCSARSAGPKTARGLQPPSTSSTVGHLTTDGPPPALNHPATTSSSTQLASCCSSTSPPAPATSPPVYRR
jgi:hypothetical protein